MKKIFILMALLGLITNISCMDKKLTPSLPARSSLYTVDLDGIDEQLENEAPNSCCSNLKRALRLYHRTHCPSSMPCLRLTEAIENYDLYKLGYHLTRENANSAVLQGGNHLNLFELALCKHDNEAHAANDKLLEIFLALRDKGFNESTEQIFTSGNLELFAQIANQDLGYITQCCPIGISFPIYLYKLFNTGKIDAKVISDIVALLKTRYAPLSLKIIEQLTQLGGIEQVFKESNTKLVSDILQTYPHLISQHEFSNMSLPFYLLKLHREKIINDETFSTFLRLLKDSNLFPEDMHEVREMINPESIESLIVGEKLEAFKKAFQASPDQALCHLHHNTYNFIEYIHFLHNLNIISSQFFDNLMNFLHSYSQHENPWAQTLAKQLNQNNGQKESTIAAWVAGVYHENELIETESIENNGACGITPRTLIDTDSEIVEIEARSREDAQALLPGIVPTDSHLTTRCKKSLSL